MFTFNVQTGQASQCFSYKNKQQNFAEQSHKSERLNKLQNQRFLLHMQTLDWNCNQCKFQTKVNEVSNYYALITTLFSIAESPQWRNYTTHMQILISKFYNICIKKHGANLSDLKQISNLQQKLYNILYLNDFALYEHMFHLIKLLLAYNQKHQILNEFLLSETLVATCRTFGQKQIKQTLWTLCQIKVSNIALINLFKQQMICDYILQKQSCLLPFLTILANYTCQARAYSIYQLGTSDLFQNAIKTSLFSQIPQIVQQAILVCSNIICYKQTRNIILKGQCFQMIQQKEGVQSQIFKEILTIIQMEAASLKSKSGNQVSNSSSLETNYS